VGVARWVTVFLVVERGMPLRVGTIWFTFFGLAGFFGNWFNGWCADRYGRRKTISVFFVMVGVLITIFTTFILGELGALLITVPFGFLLLGLYPTTFTFTTEVLPAEARGLGMSAINAFTIPLSIALPGVIGAVSNLYSLSLCFYAISLTAIIGGTVLFFTMPKIGTNLPDITRAKTDEAHNS
jgi:MFS family permease